MAAATPWSSAVSLTFTSGESGIFSLPCEHRSTDATDPPDAHSSHGESNNARSRPALSPRPGETEIPVPLRSDFFGAIANVGRMEKGATVTQILLTLGSLEIDSYFGELDRGSFFANDRCSEFRNHRIQVHRFSVDRGFAGKLLVDCGLSFKHETLGLKEEQPADPGEYRGAPRELIAQRGDLFFEDALLEHELSDLQLRFSFVVGHEQLTTFAGRSPSPDQRARRERTHTRTHTKRQLIHAVWVCAAVLHFDEHSIVTRSPSALPPDPRWLSAFLPSPSCAKSRFKPFCSGRLIQSTTPRFMVLFDEKQNRDASPASATG